MNNYKIIEFPEEWFYDIFYQVRKSIHEVIEQFNYDEKLFIQIPDYFVKICYQNPNLIERNPFEYDDETKGFKMFGYKVIPGYENFIIVFHSDMPLKNNTSYKVINLKLKSDR